MRNPRIVISAVLILIIAYLVGSAAFIVNETQQVIITQFGKPQGDPIVEPGIHFKMPFLQEANYFDKRFLEWDGDPNQVPTKDKRFIWVDTYGRWRIVDPLLYFQRVRDERGAQSRLDDILDGETRNAIANHTLVELIRSTNREFKLDDTIGADAQDILAKINEGRSQITRSILEAAAKRTTELGIELLDLRFKRINYVQEVQEKIYERMISERERIADKFRSEGQGEASKIQGDKERDLRSIRSEAYRQALEIKGNADGTATKIYAAAYNSSADARDFYEFLKTMETYRNTLSKEDWIIMSMDNNFYKYLKRPDAK
ncbi:protease modulator HflC [candidate division KSB1 bacterium]|nr:protease modulator HflC [candidate division KSB1 bacterium]